MNNMSLHTLVNFRASRQLVEAFDNVCLLSGKTRTQVLAEMMRQRVNTVGSKLPARLVREAAIDRRLNEAVEPYLEHARRQLEAEANSKRDRPLKKFSEFDLPEAR